MGRFMRTHQWGCRWDSKSHVTVRTRISRLCVQGFNKTTLNQETQTPKPQNPEKHNAGGVIGAKAKDAKRIDRPDEGIINFFSGELKRSLRGALRELQRGIKGRPNRVGFLNPDSPCTLILIPSYTQKLLHILFEVILRTCKPTPALASFWASLNKTTKRRKRTTTRRTRTTRTTTTTRRRSRTRRRRRRRRRRRTTTTRMRTRTTRMTTTIL